MRRVIYASNSANEMTASALREISRASYQNNMRDEVTGLLIYADSIFFQVIEGPASLVTNTFARIRNDCRHEGVLELADRPLRRRNFVDWSMGYYRVDGLNDEKTNWAISDLGSMLDHIPAATSPEVAVLMRAYFVGVVPSTLH